MTRNTRVRVSHALAGHAVYGALVGLAIAAFCLSIAPLRAAEPPTVSGSTHELGAAPPANNEEKKVTPEQRFQKRFPQPIKVGDLIGLPVLDDDDWTIGFVRQVVRSPDGKIFLIVPYNKWWSWADTDVGKRPVAVPIEVVGILARQLAALDMPRADFDKAPTWRASQGQPLPPDEKTLIALARR